MHRGVPYFGGARRRGCLCRQYSYFSSAASTSCKSQQGAYDVNEQCHSVREMFAHFPHNALCVLSKYSSFKRSVKYITLSASGKQYSLPVYHSLRSLSGVPTGVDKGGPGAQAPPIAGQKIFLVKTEGLSSLPPAKSGRACYDNPTGRGYFYQMSNMYTCIAYLIEIRQFC